MHVLVAGSAAVHADDSTMPSSSRANDAALRSVLMRCALMRRSETP